MLLAMHEKIIKLSKLSGGNFEDALDHPQQDIVKTIPLVFLYPVDTEFTHKLGCD